MVVEAKEEEEEEEDPPIMLYDDTRKTDFLSPTEHRNGAGREGGGGVRGEGSKVCKVDGQIQVYMFILVLHIRSVFLRVDGNENLTVIKKALANGICRA